MLEQSKKMDESQQRMEQLQGVVWTGKATEDIYVEMCDVETIIRVRILSYMLETRRNCLNGVKIWKWIIHEWEKIPTEAVKRMLQSCITGSAKKEILLFHPTGLVVKNYETGVFFYRNVEKVLTRKIRGRLETGNGGRYQRRIYWPGEVMPETEIPGQERRRVVKKPENIIILLRKSYGYKHTLQTRGAR